MAYIIIYLYACVTFVAFRQLEQANSVWESQIIPGGSWLWFFFFKNSRNSPTGQSMAVIHIRGTGSTLGSGWKVRQGNRYF